MICQYSLSQSTDQEKVAIGCLFPERYVDEVREAKPELLAFFNAARERRDHDEAKRGADCFDYIPMLDNHDPARLEKFHKYHQMDDEDDPKDFPCASARCRSCPTLTGSVVCFNRFQQLPSKITVAWCRDFADDAAYITGLDICGVDIHVYNGKRATYDVEKNILRIYRGPWGMESLIYENNNGHIWRLGED